MILGNIYIFKVFGIKFMNIFLNKQFIIKENNLEFKNIFKKEKKISESGKVCFFLFYGFVGIKKKRFMDLLNVRLIWNL